VREMGRWKGEELERRKHACTFSLNPSLRLLYDLLSRRGFRKLSGDPPARKQGSRRGEGTKQHCSGQKKKATSDNSGQHTASASTTPTRRFLCSVSDKNRRLVAHHE
jgi:hypothetical protein